MPEYLQVFKEGERAATMTADGFTQIWVVNEGGDWAPAYPLPEISRVIDNERNGDSVRR